MKNDIKSVAAAAQALVDKLKLIHDHPLYQSVWQCAYIHGISYEGGPNYVEELKDLEKVLEEEKSKLELERIFGPRKRYGKIRREGLLFGYCDTCEAVYLECPTCGNNLCNGGAGDLGPNMERLSWEEKKERTDLIKCPDCVKYYDVQDEWDKAGKTPKFEEFVEIYE